MKMYKCLVVDDEELARLLLAGYIDKVAHLELVAHCENPIEAMDILRNSPIDLLFLDIQMPELKGTELAKVIPTTTRIIFTTAYSEYALKGFELNALDYLLKPITFERFLMAISKLDGLKETLGQDEELTIKSGYTLHKVKYGDILCIESDSEYVVYHTPTKKIMSHQSLKTLEKNLPKTQFIRVHRSYIVNKTHVTQLKGRDLFVGDKLIPVSDSYYEEVKSALF